MTSAPVNGLCSAWADVEDACCDVAESSPTVYADMLDAASFVLYQLTGSQWPGVCEDTVRPAYQGHAGYNAPVWHGPALTSGFGGWGWWTGLCSAWTAGYDGGGCGCGGVQRIELGGFPIVAVSAVMVDGVLLDPSEYEVVDRGWLLRRPNLGDTTRQPRTWPCCQRIDLDDTEDHTFSVAYTFGGLPPVGGGAAALSLACDLAAACDPGDVCTVPERVASMLYENAQYEFRTVDDLPTQDGGYTGNRLADLFITAVNPAHLRAPSQVWSPDHGNRVHRLP